MGILYVNFSRFVFLLLLGVFCAIFPFHILFDEKMTIIQVGDGLLRVSPWFVEAKSSGKKLKMYDVFTMIHPMMAICYTNIEHFMNAVFLLQMKPYSELHSSSIVLKGKILGVVPLGKILGVVLVGKILGVVLLGKILGVALLDLNLQ